MYTVKIRAKLAKTGFQKVSLTPTKYVVFVTIILHRILSQISEYRFVEMIGKLGIEKQENGKKSKIKLTHFTIRAEDSCQNWILNRSFSRTCVKVFDEA